MASELAIHLLPFQAAYAFDKKLRKRNYEQVRRFVYYQQDIYKLAPEDLDLYPPSVAIAIHSCGNLANKIIELYLESQMIKHLILMPCCVGIMNNAHIPSMLRHQLSKYELWSLWLAEKAKGDVYKDKRCLSPCNAIVIAHKD